MLTLKEYIEWLYSKGIKDNDNIIFVQSNGSGYTAEVSEKPTVVKFNGCKYGPDNKWYWSNEPKWILGTN